LITHQEAARIVQQLELTPCWVAVSTALGRLAHHLRARPASIDYTRRRCLDYRTLLPASQWDDIRRRSQPGVHAGAKQLLRLARQWLFEHLTATAADHAPTHFAVTNHVGRARLASYVTELTPHLVDALNDHARAFLRSHGITD